MFPILSRVAMVSSVALSVAGSALAQVTLPDLGVSFTEYVTALGGYVTTGLGAIVGLAFAIWGVVMLVRKTRGIVR